jgi:hypothetical protein
MGIAIYFDTDIILLEKHLFLLKNVCLDIAERFNETTVVV